MSRAAHLAPEAVIAAREAFLKRHPGFVGAVIAGGDVPDPERVAYLDETLRAVIRAAAAAAPADLFSRAAKEPA